jgi:hypothetical protein
VFNTQSRREHSPNEATIDGVCTLTEEERKSLVLREQRDNKECEFEDSELSMDYNQSKDNWNPNEESNKSVQIIDSQKFPVNNGNSPYRIESQ